MAPEDNVVPLPADISFVDAAAVGMAAHVSGDMLNSATNLPADSGGRCLVIGASGGLGTVMLQGGTSGCTLYFVDIKLRIVF